jgi:hypothetical protein
LFENFDDAFLGGPKKAEKFVIVSVWLFPGMRIFAGGGNGTAGDRSTNL